MAPDGVVGPYREREASFYTVKQLWSPIIVTPPGTSSHSYIVTNRYAFLNADRCTYEWQTSAFRQPGSAESGSVVLASRTDHGRSLAPGASASWDGWEPPAASGRSANTTSDATRLIIKDSTGRVIQTYVDEPRPQPRHLAVVIVRCVCRTPRTIIPLTNEPAPVLDRQFGLTIAGCEGRFLIAIGCSRKDVNTVVLPAGRAIRWPWPTTAFGVDVLACARWKTTSLKAVCAGSISAGKDHRAASRAWTEPALPKPGPLRERHAISIKQQFWWSGSTLRRSRRLRCASGPPFERSPEEIPRSLGSEVKSPQR